MNTTQQHPITPTATDLNDPYESQSLPPHIKKALDDIDTEIAYLLAHRTPDMLGDEHFSFNPLESFERQLAARIKDWPETDRNTIIAYLKRRKAQLLAYLEDPHPYGPFRYDLAENDAYIANGVLVGQHMERLSQLSQRLRDGLQYMKGSNSALMEPHPVQRDQSIPTHLEVRRLMRQFHCDAYHATCLQHCFLRLDADGTFVRQYAQEAKQRGFDSIFLELDWTSLRLEALNCSCDKSNDPDEPCGACHARENFIPVPYEEGRTELGRFADHDTDELADTDWPGTLESVQYHKVHSDHERVPRDFSHPWIERLRSCARENLPTFFKEAWQAQQAKPWSQALAGAFWLERDIQLLKKAPAFFRWALEQLQRIGSAADLAKHGILMWDHQKAWTSSEKGLFWEAYKERKAAFSPAHPQTHGESSAS